MFSRRRKQFLMIGICIFLGSLWFMVVQLDSSSRTTRTTNDHPDIFTLKDKLKFLESELNQNKDMVEQFRKNMDILLDKRNVHNLDERKQLQKIIQQQTEDSHIHGIENENDLSLKNAVCPKLQYNTSECDVNMYQAYKNWEFDDKDGGVWKQGYKLHTNDEEWQDQMLKVFVVPHSHNDPGWIKTVDKYFQDQTRHILDNIIDILDRNENRRFIWAEMSYLSMWWSVASEQRKKSAERLIGNGQLEIVTGGWVMNDEANTHYFSIIDQMIEGNEWLGQTFNVAPKSGWAIDPFGHSPTMAYILKGMGLDNMLIQRVHYHVKKQLSLAKQLEFRWRQMWSGDESTDMVCHMMPFYSYDVPHTCGPDPKICCQFDFARLPGFKLSCPWGIRPTAITDFNVAERSRTLLDQYRKKSKLFRSNVLLIILGDDFRYSDAKETFEQFTNYEKMFDYINNERALNAVVKWGTLTEYFDAMKAEIGGTQNLPSLTGDFYTYADREDHYWSGYFVTRPFHKMQERVLESYLRGAEIVFSFALAALRRRESELTALFHGTYYPMLVGARRNLALFQHHDGITGTAKDHVVVDYGNRLKDSLINAQQITSASAQYLLSTADDANIVEFEFDEVFRVQNEPGQRRVLELDKSGGDRVVVVYNSLSYKRAGVASILVSSAAVAVRSALGLRVTAQINPVWKLELEPHSDRFELLFEVEVPAHGFVKYHLTADDNDIPRYSFARINVVNNQARNGLPPDSRVLGTFDVLPNPPTGVDFYAENDHVTAHFAHDTGLLRSITDKKTGVVTKVSVEFVKYASRTSKDKSGAYLFLPQGPATPTFSDQYRPVVRIVRGPLASHVHVVMPELTHSVTLYRVAGGVQALGVHVRNDVDIRAGYDNRELAMRVRSDVTSGRRFYTDMNAMAMQPREHHPKLPLQANFYPIPSMAFVQDDKHRLTVMTAQPLGVASLEPGQLDVIMDRRLMQDDNRGLGQGIRDNVRTPQRFVLLLERWRRPAPSDGGQLLAYPSLAAHRLSWELLHPTRAMFPPAASARDAYRDRHQPLNAPLPCSIHVLNLRAIAAAADGKAPGEASGLLIHNVGRECRLDSDERVAAAGCDATTDRFPLAQMVSVQWAHETSLSLQGMGPEVTGPVAVPPMEIRAYKVRLL